MRNFTVHKTGIAGVQFDQAPQTREAEQAEVARKAGVSRRALQNLESGRVCTLSLLIRVLRAMGKLSQLDAFLPEPGLSPIQLAKLKGRERRRAFVPRRRLKGGRI